MRRNASTGREARTFGRRRFPCVHLHLNRPARTDQERHVSFGVAMPPRPLRPVVPSERGIIQPSVVHMGGRHLRLYARSDKTARICVSDSFDARLTWSPARLTELRNPNSGLDVIRL